MAVELHHPVLLVSVMELMELYTDKVILDCTFGRGGHTSAILQQATEGSKVIALDRDIEAVDYGRKLFAKLDNVSVVHQNFSKLDVIVKEMGCYGKIDIVLMDLGVSSPQLDKAERGFSFQRNGTLDMRMDNSKGQTALQLVEKLSVEKLAVVLRDFGGEKYAMRIAKCIKQAVAEQCLNNTLDLAQLVVKAVGWREKKHPATRTFQALRIAVNDELSALKKGLEQALAVLRSGGKLMVISFHSLEDRIVKNFFKPQQELVLSKLPMIQSELDLMVNKQFVKVLKPIFPSDKEIMANPRARSAVLRVAQKI